MMDLREAMDVIKGSKQYEFNGTVLKITGYYTGKILELDLSKLDDEMLEMLQPDEDDNEDVYFEYLF